MPNYYDRQGNPLELMQWAPLREDPKYFSVTAHLIGPFLVSTIWEGIDLAFGRTILPIIFETAVFDRRASCGDWKHLHSERYAIETQAVREHRGLCGLMYALLVAEIMAGKIKELN